MKQKEMDKIILDALKKNEKLNNVMNLLNVDYEDLEEFIEQLDNLENDFQNLDKENN